MGSCEARSDLVGDISRQRHEVPARFPGKQPRPRL
jgi:hypothetical protein